MHLNYFYNKNIYFGIQCSSNYFLVFSYYTEFFWFPNNGVDDGYWENCWKNDGDEKDSVELNKAIDDHYQIASTYLFDVTTLILQPLVCISKEEHYDEDITLREIVRHIFTKVVFNLS